MLDKEDWHSLEDIAIGAAGVFGFRLCTLLVDKGLLTSGEAAGVMAATANDVRSGTGDGPRPEAGEVVARTYEQWALWLLGQRG